MKNVPYFLVLINFSVRFHNTFGGLACGLTSTTAKEDNVFFFLNTKNSANANSPITERLVLGDDERIANSRFNKNAPTVIFSHGFTSGGGGDSALAIVKAYMKHKKFYNVIVVDWCYLASPSLLISYTQGKGSVGNGWQNCYDGTENDSPLTLQDYGYDEEMDYESDQNRRQNAVPYLGSTCNVLNVGEYVAEMIQYLIQKGYTTTKRLHVMGHSLGAHVSGVAGYHVNRLIGQKVARITGFDPAKPLFEGAPLPERLDSTDAEFVDVIHSGAYSNWIPGSPLLLYALGLLIPVGHSDFYPNKGTYPQPGCFQSFSVSCSHARSFLYYAESVNNPCAFPSCRCDAYANCESNLKCRNKVYMGFLARKMKKSTEDNLDGYYTETNFEAPFGTGPSGPCNAPHMDESTDYDVGGGDYDY